MIKMRTKAETISLSHELNNSTLGEAIKYLKKLSKIHPLDAVIELSADQSYGSWFGELHLCYTRDMTPKEVKEREVWEAMCETREKEREKEQYEALKKKFEGS